MLKRQQAFPGPAKLHTNLDLAIMGEESLPLTTMRILRGAFDDSDLPFNRLGQSASAALPQIPSLQPLLV